MFPITDDSQTVITCLVSEANKMGVRVLYGCKATLLAALPQGAFSVDIVGTLASSKLMDGLQVLDGPDPRHQTLVADRVLVATGGSKTAHVWAAALGHKIDPVVPSLFTFKSHDARLKDLAGVSVQDAEVSLILPKPAASAADLDSDSAGSTPDKKRKKKPPARRRSPPGLIQRGPLLVTHEGLSGPSILRLSAFAARELNACGYKGAMVKINFVPNLSSDAQKQVLDMIRRAKTDHARKEIGSFCPVQGVDLPRRLWRSIVTGMGISPETRWADCPKSALVQMANSITGCEVLIAGRGLYKDEFVCCGGVSLASLNMRVSSTKGEITLLPIFALY
jgi:predicted flavoprotein YhiN